MSGNRSRVDRILLLVAGDRDRELLGDWLATEPGYEAVGVDSPAAVEAVDYDLCLVDQFWFDDVADRLRARREAADSCFLPTLLAVPASRGGEEDDPTVLGGETAREVIDDVVELPVGKATLRRRMGNLLRGRHASLDLAAREEQYRELVRLAPEAILLVREGRVVHANDAAVDLLSPVGAADLPGRALTELVGAASASRLEAVVEDVERAGERPEFATVDLVLADGTERAVEVAGVTVTYEDEPAAQLVVRDVTDEHRRNERLAVYGRALEAAAQGVTIADARRDDEPIVYANAAFGRITGYDIEEVIGRNCRFLQGEGTDPEPVAEVRAAIDDRRPVSVELRNYRKDGTPFWNRLDVVPVRDDDGEVTHFLGLQRDVTRRREREQRVAVLDRVLRHNLRNHLNVVRGEAGRILDGEVVEPGTARDAAEGIVRATDELLEIGDQARRFREVVTGDRHRSGVQDLRETFTDAVADLDADHPDAVVDVDLPGAVPVYVHEVVGVAFLGVVELLAETDDEGADVAVRAATVDQEAVTVEILDRARRFRTADLGVVGEGIETSVAHPQGVELWLLRWSVEHSDGEFGVDTTGDPPRILLRLRRAEDGSVADERAEANADD